VEDGCGRRAGDRGGPATRTFSHAIKELIEPKDVAEPCVPHHSNHMEER
jgi:hypothetical protein